jgi:hypothetical protein
MMWAPAVPANIIHGAPGAAGCAEMPVVSGVAHGVYNTHRWYGFVTSPVAASKLSPVRM